MIMTKKLEKSYLMMRKNPHDYDKKVGKKILNDEGFLNLDIKKSGVVLGSAVYFRHASSTKKVGKVE